MNEHYLKAELEHFKAYQESEKKIRGFRHDIRNHLICLRELAKKGKTEELRSYTEELLQGIEAANGMICCGNEIADAIINEKNLLAKQKGIHLTVEGRMPSECPIKATDICTLFSNALDNALEAQAKWEEQNPQEKWIRVQICRQGRMICLCFENPAGPADRILPWGSTSKENVREHGLGNLNMIYAAEKYNGKVTAVIEEKNGKRVYCLEILLFVPKAA